METGGHDSREDHSPSRRGARLDRPARSNLDLGLAGRTQPIACRAPCPANRTAPEVPARAFFAPGPGKLPPAFGRTRGWRCPLWGTARGGSPGFTSASLPVPFALHDEVAPMCTPREHSDHRPVHDARRQEEPGFALTFTPEPAQKVPPTSRRCQTSLIRLTIWQEVAKESVVVGAKCQTLCTRFDRAGARVRVSSATPSYAIVTKSCNRCRFRETQGRWAGTTEDRHHPK